MQASKSSPKQAVALGSSAWYAQRPGRVHPREPGNPGSAEASILGRRRRFVAEAVTDLFILRGIPAYIRSDNGPEFVAEAVRYWIAAVGARTAFIEPGSPWENGYIESFNARLRDELLRS